MKINCMNEKTIAFIADSFAWFKIQFGTNALHLDNIKCSIKPAFRVSFPLGEFLGKPQTESQLSVTTRLPCM